MRTFTQLIAHHLSVVESIQLSRRLLVSLVMLALYIILLYTQENALTVGAIVATASIANQLDYGIWDFDDWPWMIVAFTWYTLLWTAITTLFI